MDFSLRTRMKSAQLESGRNRNSFYTLRGLLMYWFDLNLYFCPENTSKFPFVQLYRTMYDCSTVLVSVTYR